MKEWLTESAPYRVPQIVVAGSPLLAKQLSSHSPFIWPPLGSLETYAPYAATLLISICSFLPAIIENKKQARRWLVASLACAVLTFGTYCYFVGCYVITVDTPFNGTQARSVGFIVKPNIRSLFPDKSDDDLLKIGGLEDAQIKRVWTPGSVLACRLCILLSFASTLAFANVGLGSGAKLNKRSK